MAEVSKRLQDFSSKVAALTQSLNVPELRKKKVDRDLAQAEAAKKAAADAITVRIPPSYYRYYYLLYMIIFDRLMLLLLLRSQREPKSTKRNTPKPLES